VEVIENLCQNSEKEVSNDRKSVSEEQTKFKFVSEQQQQQQLVMGNRKFIIIDYRI
jgi:hypothetical protein